MTTEVDTTQIEIRDNAYWPDEAQLADFAEQDAQAEKDDRAERPDKLLEDNPQYVTLYFVT